MMLPLQTMRLGASRSAPPSRNMCERHAIALVWTRGAGALTMTLCHS